MLVKLAINCNVYNQLSYFLEFDEVLFQYVLRLCKKKQAIGNDFSFLVIFGPYNLG